MVKGVWLGLLLSLFALWMPFHVSSALEVLVVCCMAGEMAG